MPGPVRWRHPFLLPAGGYHMAASGLFAMAVGWCGPLLAAALYELWPLWAGLFLELYLRPVAGSGGRVWRRLRGGALSVIGGALVMWSYLLWSLAWRRAGRQAPVLQLMGSAAGPLSALLPWGSGLDSPGSPAMLAAGFCLVAGGNWLARR